MGVWIEIMYCCHKFHQQKVTPFVGVWIEINQEVIAGSGVTVTPFVGVWIEIFYLTVIVLVL